jgi:hypothetical protein
MNGRRKILVISAVSLAALALIAVAVSRYEPDVKGSYCGHPKEFRFSPGSHAKHHCAGRDTVVDFHILYLAQTIHREETGTNATKLEELSELFPAYRIRYGLTMTSNGTNWSACIAKQDSLPGHYLLTSAGRLHFNSIQPATTNDHVLHDWSQ